MNTASTPTLDRFDRVLLRPPLTKQCEYGRLRNDAVGTLSFHVNDDYQPHSRRPGGSFNHLDRMYCIISVSTSN